MNDPLLSDYSVIMIDDIHERGINSDVIMGLLKKSFYLKYANKLYQMQTIYILTLNLL